MKEIQLTKGKVAIVDDEDYEFLSQWKWYASKANDTFYARRSMGRTKKRPFCVGISMHRLILNATKGEITDHINHNGLDNRKENLRLCTYQQNNRNSLLRPQRNTSGYKGVSYDKRKNKWKAQITIDRHPKRLGNYVDKKDAAIAYDNAARKHFGEFACTNF